MCFLVTIFGAKNIQKCYETFRMKGDVISDHFLLLWFQKDSLETVGLGLLGGGGPGALNEIMDFGGPK